MKSDAEKRASSVVIGIGLLLLAGGASTHAETEAIYPFQQDVESRLKGTADENHRYALLLPLRVAMLTPAEEYAYRSAVLSSIENLDMIEALPLLEDGLARDSTYWEGEAQDHAARLWVDFKSRGMTPEEKAAMLSQTFAPGANLRVQKEAARELEKLGPIGRQHLLDMLTGLEDSFSCDDDVLIATALAKYLWQSAVLRAERREIDLLARSTNPYVRYVCLCWYSARRDEEAVRLALGLAGTQEARKYRIRSAMLYGLAYCPGSEKVFKRNLVDARTEQASTMREDRISMTLGYMLVAIPGPFEHASDALKAEVVHVAEREIRAPRNPWGKDLRFFGLQHTNRALAEQILGTWRRSSGDADRENAPRVGESDAASVREGVEEQPLIMPAP